MHLLKLLTTGLIIIYFISCSQVHLKSQKLIHNVQLHSGHISAPIADIYLGELKYIPQISLSDQKIRLGVSTGTFYRAKNFDFLVGINASVRLFNFSTLNDNFSLGGLFLRVSHEWTTSNKRILSGNIVYSSHK